MSDFEIRIEQLEIKVAYQDATIEQLNNVVINQQNQLDKLQEQIKFLSNKFKSVEPSMVADVSEETPPPHY